MGSRKKCIAVCFCTTVVPRNVLTTKNRSDQSEGVSEDRQWLVTAPFGNRRDVPRGGPVPPGLTTGVQSQGWDKYCPAGKYQWKMPENAGMANTQKITEVANTGTYE